MIITNNSLTISSYIQNLNIPGSHTCRIIIDPHTQTLTVDGVSVYRHISSDILLQQLMGVDVSKIEITMELNETITNTNRITATMYADMELNSAVELTQTLTAVLSYLVDISSDIENSSTITAILSEMFDISVAIELQQTITSALVSVRTATIADYSLDTIASMASDSILSLCEIEIS